MAFAPLASPKLHEFFLQLVRRSFHQLGISDSEVFDYIAGVLAEFSHSSRWLRLRDSEGRRLTSTVEMLLARADQEAVGMSRVQWERSLRKYVGDYTLFMTGLFRRFVERGGYLGYYMEEGARSYQAVSSLDVSMYQPGFLLFEELGRRFEQYSGALDFMRKCYFAPAPGEDPFAGFFQQIEGWVRQGLSNN
ncbi:MAG TPA: hypothetical protein VFB15_01100 [Candidatus Binataceae bacterium]|jgi:hypothetical protein|nr:hypothetical protein [Candidatus Binataceae bacterium]